jgi:hypothetical protein
MRALTLLFFSVATIFLGEIAHVLMQAARPFATGYQMIDTLEMVGGVLFFFMAMGAAIDDTVRRLRRRDARRRQQFKAAYRDWAMSRIPPSYRPTDSDQSMVNPAEPSFSADGSWVCQRCKSLNHVTSLRCYSCSTWRATDPIPATT